MAIGSGDGSANFSPCFGGPLAGISVKDISDAVLGNNSGGVDDIASRILTADSDTLVRLKEAELKFKADLQRLEVDLERVAADDRNSAREREVAAHDRTPAVISALVLLGYFTVLGVILFQPLPDSARDAIYLLLGALTAALGQVITYYFGSSAGSAQKNTMLEKLIAVPPASTKQNT